MRRTIAGMLWIVLGLLTPRAVFACMWDSDTLANEAKGLPETVQIITGRFERNPPLFYEMRLKRVAAELAKDPGLLNDYDDAGVACDRLSRDDEAIAWMQQKRARLEAADRAAPEIKEQWYRYYANIGTFRAHRWLRAGADRAHIAEMQQARTEIARAIDINPDAHFGREKVQLGFMDWLIAPGAKWSSEAGQIRALIPESNDRDAIRKGLCGLIVLGNAWESVDLFLVLSDQSVGRKPTVCYLAALRCKELLSQGRHSLHPERFPDSAILPYLSGRRLGLAGDIPKEVEGQYHQLRAEAEAWQQSRTDYMMTRLKAGRHPDTDPTFWNAWKETPPPSLDLPWYRVFAARIFTPQYLYNMAPLFALGLLMLAAGLWLVRWSMNRRAAHTLKKV